MNERSNENDVATIENFLTVNKHTPADHGWRYYETEEKDKFKMRTLTKFTHQFSEMQHDTGESAASSIFCLVAISIMTVIVTTIVYFTNTYIQ